MRVAVYDPFGFELGTMFALPHLLLLLVLPSPLLDWDAQFPDVLPDRCTRPELPPFPCACRDYMFRWRSLACLRGPSTCGSSAWRLLSLVKFQAFLSFEDLGVFLACIPWCC